eukprot:NODE_581_length_5739_cov_0.670922.p3 type:complete len:238 gc:universal NODE_581_length_5739_cov_0.670922:3991-3278(-)
MKPDIPEISVFCTKEQLRHVGQIITELDENTKLFRDIESAITILKAVVPRINGIVPSDCPFLVYNMQCTKVSEVWDLLQSSTKLQNQLDDQNFTITLQKFVEFQPQEEFTAFCTDGKLLGISQHCIDCYFGYSDDLLYKVKDTILKRVATMPFQSGDRSFHFIVSESKVSHLSNSDWSNCLLFTKRELQRVTNPPYIKVVSTSGGVIYKHRPNFFPLDVKSGATVGEMADLIADSIY